MICGSRLLHYYLASAHLVYLSILIIPFNIYCLQAPLYNCSLALYYLLVIKFNWTNAKLVKIERYVHGLIITFTVGTSIAGLPLTMYNEVHAVCWVIGYPSECGNSSWKYSDVPCERGDWAWLFGIILFYGPLWLCVLLTIIAMTMIYIQVRNTFRKNDKYRFQGNVRRPSVMNNNRTSMNNNGLGGPSGVTTDSAPSNSQTTNHRSLNAAGQQMSSRMSRISIFKTKRPDMKELEELHEAMEHEEETDQPEGDFADDAEEEEKQAEELLEHPSALAPHARNAYTAADSEVSGGIGLKTGWLEANAAAENGPTTITASANSEATGSRFSVHPNRRPSASRSRKQNMFATQAILYSGSFFITWTPSTIWSIAYWFGAGGIGFDLAAATCEPLQGFWNMLIFIRSRPSSQEKLRRVFGSCCCFFLALLPKLDESLDRSSRASFSRGGAGDSTASNLANGKRRRNSSSYRSNNSLEPISTSERVDPGMERVPEEETSVQVDTTEPISGDDLSR